MIRYLVAFILVIPLLAQAQVIKDTKQPAKLSEGLWVLSSGWTTKIPPEGKVNAPGRLEELTPGQKFAIALIVKGDGHEGLLKEPILAVRITTGTDVIKKRDLKPIAIRQIKASGADMILRALEASGVKAQDKETVEKLTSMVSLVIFEPSWEAPALAKEENIQIEVTITGGITPLPTIKPVNLKLRSWSFWQKSPEPDEATLEKLLRDFHNSPHPGRLLPMLKAAARSKAFGQASTLGFFVAAFRDYSMARQEAIKALPSLDPLLKLAFLMVLRLDGQDISGMVDGLSEDKVSALQRVHPLKDPRTNVPFTDPVDPQAVMGIGSSMDQCWGGWMATGDPSYLRALIDQLNGAPDFPAFQAWTKAKSGAKGLNAQVARGLSYQVAGWSLSSFQRTDPQVADWLLYWQQDSNLHPLIREQIRTLSNNPAFQKNN